jgi:flavin-dependent dehydrogenase
MQMQFDVAVLGGGPAGSATGLALARLGYAVVLIERSGYEDGRIGETLPPGVRKPLVELRLWDAFLADGHLPGPGIRSAWGRVDLYENDFIFNPYGAGWHLDRARFDALLARESEKAGVSVRRRTRLLSSHETAAGGWELRINSAGAPEQIDARFVVDATGRMPAFACRQGARRLVLDHLVGVVAVLPSSSSRNAPDTAFMLVESIEEGWWYSALLPSGRMIVAYMTDADLFAHGSRSRSGFWQSQLRQAVHTYERLGGRTRDLSLRVVAANSMVLDHAAGHNWLAVGDAAASFDPLSSQGIVRALESGRRAAAAIHGHFAGDRSVLQGCALALREQYQRYLDARLEYYRREQRWPHAVFWRRRQRRPQLRAGAICG